MDCSPAKDAGQQTRAQTIHMVDRHRDHHAVVLGDLQTVDTAFRGRHQKVGVMHAPFGFARAARGAQINARLFHVMGRATGDFGDLDLGRVAVGGDGDAHDRVREIGARGVDINRTRQQRTGQTHIQRRNQRGQRPDIVVQRQNHAFTGQTGGGQMLFDLIGQIGHPAMRAGLRDVRNCTARRPVAIAHHFTKHVLVFP